MRIESAKKHFLKVTGIRETMKVHLTDSWTLTDEHPKAERGDPILIDLGIWKVYRPRDRVGAFQLRKSYPLQLKRGGKMISCLKRFSSWLGSKTKLIKFNQAMKPS